MLGTNQSCKFNIVSLAIANPRLILTLDSEFHKRVTALLSLGETTQPRTGSLHSATAHLPLPLPAHAKPAHRSTLVLNKPCKKRLVIAQFLRSLRSALRANTAELFQRSCVGPAALFQAQAVYEARSRQRFTISGSSHAS